MKFKYHHIEMYKPNARLQTGEIDIFVDDEDAEFSFLTILDDWNRRSPKIKFWRHDND